MLCATVLHNVSADSFLRYNAKTSRLYHANTFLVRADDVERAGNIVWAVTNVDDAEHLSLMHPELSHHRDDVQRYRERGNRSLSVGDVIVFHEGERIAGVLVVEQVGFRRLSGVPRFYTAGRTVTHSAAHTASVERAERYRDGVTGTEAERVAEAITEAFRQEE